MPKAKVFSTDQTTTDDAERYTTTLMMYMMKHPELSISEIVHRVLPKPELSNNENVGKLSELLDKVE